MNAPDLFKNYTDAEQDCKDSKGLLQRITTFKQFVHCTALAIPRISIKYKQMKAGIHGNLVFRSFIKISGFMATTVLNISIPKIVESPFQGRFMNMGHLSLPQVKKRLDELKTSIAESGLVQPITVRAVGDGYELIDGHRRLEAYRQLGRGNIPAIIKEADDKQTQAMSITANLQRSNLSNLEKAIAFEKILAAGVFKNKKELSQAIGKDATYVSDVINMLKMDKRILNHIAKHNPNADVRLLRIVRQVEKIDEKGISNKQNTLYLHYVHEKLTRGQLTRLVEKEKSVKTETPAPFQIKINSRGFSLQLQQKLSKAQQARFQEILEKKIQESLEELK